MTKQFRCRLALGCAIALTATLLSSCSSLTAKPPATPQWVFDRPSIEELRHSPRKVFAHYFSPFPVSIDNKPADRDYYKNGYLALNGERGKHKTYGGYLRQRPLPRPPRPEKNWREKDIADEIKLAADLGLDGFSYDILSYSGKHWNYLLTLLKVAEQTDKDFKIMLMPDMNAGFKGHPEKLVPSICQVADHPSLFRDEKGRLVIAPFNAHQQSPEWWKKTIAELKAKNIEVMFVPLFQGWWRYADKYAAVSDGFSDWGAGTVGEVIRSPRKDSPKLSKKYGKLWMAPIRPQDSRPKSFCAFEAGNSDLFRSMWRIAIDGGADWAQVITWNDYSEASEIAPSSETKYGFYDLTAYYVTWFKTGIQPKIERDGIYYFYRPQSTDASPDLTKQKRKFKVVGKPCNDIELLAFLTEPGTLEIEINGKKSTKQTPAGITSFKIPLQDGTPVFRLIRNDKTVVELKGSTPISCGKVEFQDLLYRADGKVAK